mmetsp:Transcript_9328/g.19923  ORF Transcript_9328/g.19923 Transcript_9328/m.19923 type:complete len:167 (-) Transcript_9328:138-638(-)
MNDGWSGEYLHEGAQAPAAPTPWLHTPALGAGLLLLQSLDKPCRNRPTTPALMSSLLPLLLHFAQEDTRGPASCHQGLDRSAAAVDIRCFIGAEAWPQYDVLGTLSTASPSGIDPTIFRFPSASFSLFARAGSISGRPALPHSAALAVAAAPPPNTVFHSDGERPS